MSRPPAPVSTRRAFALALAALLAALAALTAGCRVITAAELDQFGTRTYTDVSKAQLMAAVVTALKSQGYEIVTNDAAAGRIKTGPKIVVVHATGDAYSARAAASEIAWTLDVDARGSDAIVRAVPRGYQAGQAVEATRFSYAYAVAAFKTLFDEIDSNLPNHAGGLGLSGEVASKDADKDAGKGASASSKDAGASGKDAGSSGKDSGAATKDAGASKDAGKTKSSK